MLVWQTSPAFLPPTVYQLEEFGMPRMISKKIHAVKLIDFYNQEQNIHTILNKFIQIGLGELFNRVQLSPFEWYIVEYFYDGIKASN